MQSYTSLESIACVYYKKLSAPVNMFTIVAISNGFSTEMYIMQFALGSLSWVWKLI